MYNAYVLDPSMWYKRKKSRAKTVNYDKNVISWMGDSMKK
jgi:hypothetical protein